MVIFRLSFKMICGALPAAVPLISSGVRREARGGLPLPLCV